MPASSSGPAHPPLSCLRLPRERGLAANRDHRPATLVALPPVGLMMDCCRCYRRSLPSPGRFGLGPGSCEREHALSEKSGRTATQDLTIDGVAVHKGDRVWLSYMGANHDPQRFSSPHDL